VNVARVARGNTIRRRVNKSRFNLWFGAATTAITACAALLSLIWTPYSVSAISIRERLQGPSMKHWLGTDPFGRDVLSLLMAGAQNAIVIGIVAVLIGAGIGVALGLLAAARRGLIEEVIMRACDFVFSFPVVLSAIMLAAALGPSSINSMGAIGFYSIPIFARIARGSAQVVWQREFILAARTAGKGPFAISLQHVLPNIVNLIVVQMTISFAVAILADAALSYLGLGTPPPAPSWGRMLQEAQSYMVQNPYLAIFPGLTIALVVLGLNMLGDALRDLLDPRVSRSR
jgi:peptide/nickel transport system permease protein